MMTHIEGPIVQSIYDMALTSWWKNFNPPLPLINHKPIYDIANSRNLYQFGNDHPVIESKGDLENSANQSRKILAEHHSQAIEPDSSHNYHQNMIKKEEIWDKSDQDEADRVDGQFTSENSINTHLSELNQSNENHKKHYETQRPKHRSTDNLTLFFYIDTGSKIDATDTNPPPNAAAFKPIILHKAHDPFPIALVNRPPRGSE